ncbi:hypothetical protein Hdeb2414_s0249g00847791 [Helianthus debilis subsp. tardiflorus]
MKGGKSTGAMKKIDAKYGFIIYVWLYMFNNLRKCNSLRFYRSIVILTLVSEYML